MEVKICIQFLMTFYCSFSFPLSLRKLVVDMIGYYIKWCVHQRNVNCFKITKKNYNLFFYCGWILIEKNSIRDARTPQPVEIFFNTMRLEVVKQYKEQCQLYNGPNIV